MSRVPKWKFEKTKVKVVFRLQFHATHIPQPGWDKLFVSFISADTAKATAKTTKANVRNGNCKWSDPIYETTRLLQDTRTKKYDEKLYKLVVAMGSTRSSLLGEVNINLADFADALKPLSVTLPLHGCEFGTVLHVTIQLLTSKTGFREFELQRELNEKGFLVLSGQKSPDPTAPVASSSETMYTDKVSTRVWLKSDSAELPSVEGTGESNESYEDSAIGIDGSSYTSDSLHAEKNEGYSTHENDSLKSTNFIDVGGFPHGLNHQPEKEGQSDNQLWTQKSNEWIHGWNSDYAMENDIVSAYEENNRLKVRLEIAESTISQLKLGASSLQTLTDEFGVEAQNLAQQLTIELASGEKMAAEVSRLKSECLKLKSDIEGLKFANLHLRSGTCPSPRKLEDASFNDKPRDHAFLRDHHSISQDFQIEWLQGLLLIEWGVRDIQSKISHGYHEDHSEFLHPDFEALEFLLQNLKQKIMEAPSLELVSDTHRKEIKMPGSLKPECLFQGQALERSCKGSHGLDGMFSFSSGLHQVALCTNRMMEDRICELANELELSKTEKESLMKKMNQMECYYESIIQEIEVAQKHTVNELENVKMEHANCLLTVSALQSQIEKLHQDMNQQFIRFAEDRHSLDALNTELEKRAVVSEMALRRVRRNYAVAVDHLQKDLQLLSFQVLSMYETNETLAKQVPSDASDLRLHYYPDELSDEAHRHLQHQSHYKSNVERMQSETVELKSKNVLFPVHDSVQTSDEHANGMMIKNIGQLASQQNSFQGQKYLVVPCVLSLATPSNNELPEMLANIKSYLGPQVSGNLEQVKNQNCFGETETQTNPGKIYCEEIKPSCHVLKDLHAKTEAELSELHLLNLQSEVLSYVLEEILHDSNDILMHMKGKIIELEQQLGHSNEMEKSFLLKLQHVQDEARILRDNENRYISTCDDSTLKNHFLEVKLQGVLEENAFLIQKVAENERLTMEYRAFESKYQASAEENKELELLLEHESIEKAHLEAEVNSINAKFKSLKEDFDNQCSVNDELQRTAVYIQKNLEDLCSTLVPFNDQISEPAVDGILILESENYGDVFLHLKHFQQESYRRISSLQQEKMEIEEERDNSQCSLKDTEFKISSMKQKFESELEELTKKLDFSNTLIEKLKLELLDITKKFKITSESEEQHMIKNQEFLSYLQTLEHKLHFASDENKDIVKQLQEFEGVHEELEKTKSCYTDCVQENRELMLSVQSGKETSIQLESELNDLKESLRCTCEDQQSEKKLRAELEALISDLTSRLKEKTQQLLSLDEQNSALAHLKHRLLDLESENFALQHRLFDSEECRRKQDTETLSLHSHIADLETILVMNSLSADIEAAYLRRQFHSEMWELVDQLKTSETDIENVYFKHLDVASLKKCTVNEAQLVDENARLSKSFESLKSEFDVIVSEREDLVDYINERNTICTEAEDLKARAAMVESFHSLEKHSYENEIRQLKNMLLCFEEEVDYLRSSRDELAAMDIVLRSTLSEQQAELSMLEECVAELRKLREQNKELAHKLSEQILKTEEFKNLSIHLRELKDKADAECNQACQRKDSEGSSHATQESLRIAFIKEQCETKLRELRNQLYGSKRHAEEMLYKLQDALDEIESGKKREVSLIKQNEELSTKVSELESELQILSTDKRELVKSYDRMKAELECTVLSLDCCKEEKLKYEAYLHECNEEKTKIRVELDLVKRLLENMSSSEDIPCQIFCLPGVSNATSIGETLEDGDSTLAVNHEGSNGSAISHEKYKVNAECVNSVDTVKGDQVLDRSISCGEEEDLLALQNGLVSSSLCEKESHLENNTKQIAEVKEHFKEKQRLKFEMDLLHKKLERLKNDNIVSLLQLEDQNLDQALKGLQRELSQLESANEHLGNMFPLVREFSGTSNVLQRVLALELELAESLQVKKPDSRFQSSFLKQHNNEEAVFQSFRDINELIKDMLELKRWNATVETELKEMHGQYSQLSLQFAEVEGERQRLLMTLKNRLPEKLEPS